MRSSAGRTPDQLDAGAPRPVTTTSVSGPVPRQCSHCRTPAAFTISSTARAVGAGVGLVDVAATDVAGALELVGELGDADDGGAVTVVGAASEEPTVEAAPVDEARVDPDVTAPSLAHAVSSSPQASSGTSARPLTAPP